MFKRNVQTQMFKRKVVDLNLDLSAREFLDYPPKASNGHKTFWT